MKKFIITFLSVIFSVLSFSQTGNVEKQIIFSPERGQDQKLIEFVNNTGSQIIQHYDQLGWYLIQIPDSSNQNDFIKQCSQLSFCKNVYKDEVMEYKREYIPSDANFNLAWHLKQANDADIDADEAWDLLSNNGGYTTVAVFDGGFETTHEDLIGNYNTVFNAVTNLPYNGQFVNSFDRHGVACSGTIAAVTNNNIGVASVGNNLQVMPINIMSAVSSGGSFSTSSSIQINAINAAMSNPTCVAISMSYSGSSYSQALSDAFTLARTTARGGKGILCFASSGNGYSGTAGEENSSREFDGRKVKSMIEELQSTGRWTFTFVGANIDSLSTARTYGIDSKNVMQFSSDVNSNSRVYAAMSKSFKSRAVAMDGGTYQADTFLSDEDKDVTSK